MDKRKPNLICPCCGEWNYPVDTMYYNQQYTEPDESGFFITKFIKRCKFICESCGAKWKESDICDTFYYQKNGPNCIRLNNIPLLE